MDAHAGPCNGTEKGREARPWHPGFAPLVSDGSSPLIDIAHGTHLLLAGARLGEELGESFSTADPTASPHAALTHKPSSLGWFRVFATSVAPAWRRLAAFLDIPGMMSTASSPSSIQPPWESLPTTQLSTGQTHQPPGSLGKGSYCFSSQTMGNDRDFG